MLPHRPSLAIAPDGAFVGSVVVRPFGSLALPRPPCAFTIAGLNIQAPEIRALGIRAQRLPIGCDRRWPDRVANRRMLRKNAASSIRGPRAATSFRFIVRRGS